MSFFVFISILAGLIIVVMIKGALDEQSRKKAYRQYLESQYGAYQKKQYGIDEMRRIARRYHYQQEAIDTESVAVLDEITWNDLEMDRLYAQINVTQSAAGAEYLYGMLHMPHLETQPLEALEQHLVYYDTHKEARIRTQEICHELGNMGKYSVYDYILYFCDAKADNKYKHIVSGIIFLLSFPLVFYNASYGIVWFIASACVNVLSYLRTKRQILPYLTAISYIRRLLLTADALTNGQAEDIPEEIGAMYREMAECTERLRKFRRHAKFVSGMQDSSGSPIQLITDYIRMFTHIDLIQYGLMLEELQKHKACIMRILDIVGYVDAVIAIASYRKSCEIWSVPELSEQSKELQLTGGVHPLLQNAVPNTYMGKRGALITGSNASGKSTFLKMVALNAVLAQTIHTVTAACYRGQLFRIYSSMSLRDSLSGGDSYYMVEIKALKRILDASEYHTSPLLCFVDEVLRGTNTVERIAASSQILRRLSEKRVYCFAATHDVELTYLLEKEYDNYHFREEIEGKDIVFSYQLLSGRATTRNAITLLSQLGFDEEVVEQAKRLAERFLETNQWAEEEESNDEC